MGSRGTPPRALTGFALLWLFSASCVVDDQPPSDDTPRISGTIVVSATGLSGTSLDPPRSQGAGLMVLKTACDALFSLDPDSGEIQPALAEVKSMAEDGLKMTIELSKGINFHDGSPLTAEAAAASLSRVVEPGAGSPWAPLLRPISGFEGVQSGSSVSLNGLRAVDDNTLEINLTEPYAEFPAVLAHPSLTPISQTPPEGEGQIPSCAGPYRIESGAGESEFRLHRMTSYRGRGRPQDGPATIVVRSFETPEAAVEAFGRAESDVVELPESRAVDPGAGTGDLVSRKTPQVTYLAFDTTRPPTSEPSLRRAISLSVDRLAIIDAAFGDDRQPATRWLGGRTEPAPASRCAEVARKVADPEASKASLAESGQAPQPLSLFYDRERTGRLVAQAIQVQVKDALGLDLELSALESPAFQASVLERAAPGIWMVTAMPTISTPERLLGSLFVTGSGENSTGFADPEFDSLVMRARRTSDSDQRDRLYEAAEELICDRMPGVPLWTGVRHWIFNPAKLGFNGPETDVFGDLLLRNAQAREPAV